MREHWFVSQGQLHLMLALEWELPWKAGKLLFILLAKLWNHVDTAVHHILLFSDCESSTFYSTTGL